MVVRRFITDRERIEKEIQKHSSWCSKKCTTFLPAEYRKARLDGRSRQEVQDNRKLCHREGTNGTAKD
jgi:hypothetical protein